MPKHLSSMAIGLAAQLKAGRRVIREKSMEKSVNLQGQILMSSKQHLPLNLSQITITPEILRSEERRVGKECRSRWSRYQWKKKMGDARVMRKDSGRGEEA